MDNQTESFNPYLQWLEIPTEDQPPNHYRLLGVDDFEPDSKVIDEAAKARVAYLHRIAAGPERKAVQQLLNEVASARRTLLNAGAKAAYDERLQTVAEPDEASFAPAFQFAAADSGVRKAATGNVATAPRRRKRSRINDWRIHVISVSILVGITLTVLLYNSLNGQRLASQPPASAYQPAKKSTSKSPKGQHAGRSLAAELNRNSTAGSSSLASDLSAANMTEPAPVQPDTQPAQPDTQPAQPDTQPAEPKNAPAPKNVAKLKLSDNWLDGMTVVEDFSSSLEGRFIKTETDDRIALEEEHLVIKQAVDDKKYVLLASEKIVLLPGQSVALQTNLTKGLPDQMRVGLGAGPLRIFVQSKPKNLDIFAFRTKLATLTPIEDQNLTLMLIRDVQDHDAVNWIVRAGDKNVSGRVRLDGLPLEAPVMILAVCPQSATSKPIWVDDLRHGIQSQPPNLENPNEIKVEVPPKK